MIYIYKYQMKNIYYQSPFPKYVLKASYNRQQQKFSLQVQNSDSSRIYKREISKEEFKQNRDQYPFDGLENLIDIIGQQMIKPNGIILRDQGALNLSYEYSLNGYTLNKKFSIKLDLLNIQNSKTPIDITQKKNKLQKNIDIYRLSGETSQKKDLKNYKLTKYVFYFFLFLIVFCFFASIFYENSVKKSVTIGFGIVFIIAYIILKKIETNYQQTKDLVEVRTNDADQKFIYLSTTHKIHRFHFYKIDIIEEQKYFLGELPLQKEQKYFFGLKLTADIKKHFVIGFTIGKNSLSIPSDLCYYVNEGFVKIANKTYKCKKCNGDQVTMLLDLSIEEVAFGINEEIIFRSKIQNLNFNNIYPFLKVDKDVKISPNDFI